MAFYFFEGVDNEFLREKARQWNVKRKKKHLYNFQKLPKDIIVHYFRNDKKNNCDVLNISQTVREYV